MEDLRGVDVAFPVLHGPMGEDGTVESDTANRRCCELRKPKIARPAIDKITSNRTTMKRWPRTTGALESGTSVEGEDMGSPYNKCRPLWMRTRRACLDESDCA